MSKNILLVKNNRLIKSLLAMMLSTVIVLSGFSYAHADENTSVKVLGEDVSNGSFYKLSEGALSTDGATEADYNLYFDISKNTLYLKDFNYEGSGSLNDNAEICVIDISAWENVNIICQGKNSISLSAHGNIEGQKISTVNATNAGLSIETKAGGSLTINVNGQNYVEYNQNSEKDMISAIRSDANVYVNADLKIDIKDADPENGAILSAFDCSELKMDKMSNVSITTGEAYETYGILCSGNAEVYGAKLTIDVAESIANDKRSNAINCDGTFTVSERAYLDCKSFNNGIVAGTILVNDFDLFKVETSDEAAKAIEIKDAQNGALIINIERNLANFETEYSAGRADSMKKINSINAKVFENPCISLKIYSKIDVIEFKMPMLGSELDTQINCKSEFIKDTNVYWYEISENSENGELQKTAIEYPEKTSFEAGKSYEVLFEFIADENYTPSRNYLLTLIDGLECESYVENDNIYAVITTDKIAEASMKSDVNKWNIGEDKGNISYELDGEYTNDVIVTIDNRGINEEYYKYKNGNVIISDQALNSLLKGDHEIKVTSFKDGKVLSTASAFIKVNREAGGNYFWRIIAVGAVVLAVVVASMLIKRKNNK